MSWSYDEALDRAKRSHEETADLTVTDVVQEIDFDLISRLHPRRVTGTHLYVDVSKFNTPAAGRGCRRGSERAPAATRLPPRGQQDHPQGLGRAARLSRAHLPAYQLTAWQAEREVTSKGCAGTAPASDRLRSPL